MRHLPAEAAPTRAGTGTHLPVTAKVQIFAERSKSDRGLEVERSGTPANGNMKAISASRMANCQRAGSPTMHKL